MWIRSDTYLQVNHGVLRSCSVVFGSEKDPKNTPPPESWVNEEGGTARGGTDSNSRPCFALIGG